MLNPTCKTFSIRKLQSLCKNNAAPGISFIPRSPARNPSSVVLNKPAPTSSHNPGASFSRGGLTIGGGRGSGASASGWSPHGGMMGK